MKGSLSLRGFRKLRTGAIVATGVFLIGLANVQTTVQASEEDGVWVARTVEQVKADIQKEDNFFKYEIKWGDTLSVISEATNIPVDVLKEMNRISDRNLFLPHNELLYTEGESVTDLKTKHKIIIKESYGKKEVRTYEVVLQKNHETAEVSFELKETTEKVQATYTSVVSYDEVYNLVSEPVEDVTEAPTPAQPTEENPTAPGTTETPAAPGATETPTPAQPAEETPAVPGATEQPTPAQPAETTPAGSGATETPLSTKPAEEHPAAPGATETKPAEEYPAAPGATETPAPTKPTEENPTVPGTTETPAPGATEIPTPAQPAEETPAASGATEQPTSAQPAEETLAGSGATEQPTPAEPAETTPAGSEATETPAPTKPTEENPTAPGTTETPAPAQPAETTPAGSGTTETPAPTKPAEEHPAAPGATETPTPAQPTEEKPATSGTTENPASAQPTEENPTAPGTTETPAPAQPAETTPAGSGTTETPAPTKPAEEHPAAPGATETPTPAQPAETTPAGTGATETPTPAQPAEEKPATSGTTETPAPAQPAETTPAGSEATETPAPTKPAEEHPEAPGATETPTPADSNNQNNPTEPKDDVEKGLEENDAELESRKNIKLEEIESSSLPSSEKEAAKLKVEEFTNKAKEAMKQAKTTDDQAAVVDNYSDDLATINTPGVDQGKPDYTNSGLSGNGPEGTHIGDNNAIGHGNSTPENTGFRSAPVYQPRVTRRARSVDEPKNKVSIYYNYDGMKDIPGFFNDLDSKNEVEVPQKAPAQTLKSILKSKIDQKKVELEKKGYKIADEYFVGIDQENATHYDYVVTFTKA